MMLGNIDTICHVYTTRYHNMSVWYGMYSTVFWKDGYTDMRGRFDYASLSTRSVSSVEKFSVLVMSDDGGAVVREASPPKL